MKLRIITFKGNKFLRAEDVDRIIRALGDSEPNDTQARIDELADNIKRAAQASNTPDIAKMLDL